MCKKFAQVGFLVAEFALVKAMGGCLPLIHGRNMGEPKTGSSRPRAKKFGGCHKHHEKRMLVRFAQQKMHFWLC